MPIAKALQEHPALGTGVGEESGLFDVAGHQRSVPKGTVGDATKEIRILAINGSERPDGTTSECLRYAANYLSAAGVELNVIHLATYRILTCPCGRCNSRTDPCPVDDDMDMIVDEMRSVDAIIYAVSVHGFGMASVMQRFIERAGVGRLRFNRRLADKVGAALVVGRRYSHEAVHAQLNNNLLLNRMIIAGSGFPATSCSGGPTSVAADVEGLDSMYSMLNRILQIARWRRQVSSTLEPAPHRELRVGVFS